MKSSDFLIEISRKKNSKIILDFTVTERIEINSKIDISEFTFQDCTFNESFTIKENNLKSGLKLINCKFKSELIFIGNTSKEYNSLFNISYCNIEITNCNIETLIFKDINEFERGIIINSSVISNFLFGGIISNGNLEIKKTTIKNRFIGIKNILSLGSIKISDNSSISCRIRLENNNTSVSFLDSSFDERIDVWGGELGSYIANNCIFENEVFVKAVSIKTYFSIVDNKYNKSITISILDEINGITGSLNKIYILNCKFLGNIDFQGNNNIIEELVIDTSSELEGTIFLNNLCFNETMLKGVNLNCNIFFHSCFFNKLVLNKLVNYSTISIMTGGSYGEQTELSILSSNLGNTNIYDFNFDSFNKINITNSVISEITTANIAWFKKGSLNISISKSLFGIKQNREVFRQLKYALEKNGNRIDSLVFKSYEMSAFKNELYYNKRKFLRIFSVDTFILWLGQTNNYGINWFKPVLLVLGFSFIFYILLVVCISEELSFAISFDKQSIYITFNELKKYLYTYPQLLNPVHNIKEIFAESVYNIFSIQLIDYTLKIFLAFFIFQIISAFRKFMK